MKCDEARSLFTLAGFDVLRIKPLPDGYGYSPDDERYFETVPRQAWWFVKTPFGWIEIGWRKRVINIDWQDTPYRGVVTEDQVTKDDEMVHAYSLADAVTYLTTLRGRLTPLSAQSQETPT